MNQFSHFTLTDIIFPANGYHLLHLNVLIAL